MTRSDTLCPMLSHRGTEHNNMDFIKGTSTTIVTVAGEATPNVHSARQRHVDVAATGVAIVIDVPCRNVLLKQP
ncbi:hypothetical protein Y032_0724g1847 [Ancylostoma ceylanicum]|uniref:Uncharacterized protein n=1 Tax=Ancylostoma ceylanicum TaxID=53326 RepID=A0A016WGA2_9BILA|nr:hypothetical protein Y032_0724g1847 [Ancylostoma ceylanicum]